MYFDERTQYCKTLAPVENGIIYYKYFSVDFVSGLPKKSRFEKIP